MDIDIYAIESEILLARMKKIEELCQEAYELADSEKDREYINMLYEGKMAKLSTVVGNSTAYGFLQALMIAEDIRRIISYIPQKIAAKVVTLVTNKYDTEIVNYQEFDDKEYIKLWSEIKLITAITKLKSKGSIDMNDSHVKKILEYAKNINEESKKWKSRILTKPRTVRYSDIAEKNIRLELQQYKICYEISKRSLSKMQRHVESILKKNPNPSADTLKVIRAAIIVSKSMVSVAKNGITKSLQIQNQIYKSYGKKQLVL